MGQSITLMHFVILISGLLLFSFIYIVDAKMQRKLISGYNCFQLTRGVSLGVSQVIEILLWGGQS